MNYNLSIRDIEYVLAVYNEKSFTAAAAKLYISQPSLSQAVKKIEDNLGYIIFQRTRKGVKLSEEGECFIKACMHIKKSLRDYDNEINDLKTLHSGHISIGMPFYLGEHVMPPVLAAFRRKYPDVEISLMERHSQQLEACLVQGEIDIALMPLPLDDNSLDYIPLKTSELMVVMSGSDPYRKFVQKDSDGNEFIDLRDLSGAPIITGLPGQRIRKGVDMLFSRLGITLNIAIASRSIRTIIRLASIGMGIALTPDMYIHDDDAFNDDMYVCRIKEGQSLPWIFAAAYAQNDYLSNAAQQFLSTMIEVVPQIEQA
ncbi:MAG: LysR family transcriptional regulator [Firmicutes bacterium]|nr:LysR family transcriptional regulator [Bacillota bacterium]